MKCGKSPVRAGNCSKLVSFISGPQSGGSSSDAYVDPTRILIAGNSYTYTPVGLNTVLNELLEAKGFAGIAFNQYASDGLSTTNHLANAALIDDLQEGVSHFVIQWLSLEGCKPDLRPTFLDNVSALAAYAFEGNPDCRIILHCPPAYAPGTAAIAANGFSDWEDMWNEQITGMELAYDRIRTDFPARPRPSKIDNNKQIRFWGAYLDGSNASFNDFHDADGQHNTYQRMGSFAANIATAITGLNFSDVAVVAYGAGGANLLLESIGAADLAAKSFQGQKFGRYRPLITSHPVPEVVDLGDNASFTVGVEAIGDVTYQWKLDGVDIVGATSATININSVDAGDLGEYTATVTNVVEAVESQSAELSETIAAVTAFNMNFTMSALGAVATYNKIAPVTPEALTSAVGVPVALNSTVGGATGYTWTVTTAAGGGANNTGVDGAFGLPTGVTNTFWAINAGQPVTGQITGLPQSPTRFRLCGTRANDGSARQTKVTFQGAGAPVIVQYNGGSTPGAIPTATVTPDGTGKVVITVETDTGNTTTFAYISCLLVDPAP